VRRLAAITGPAPPPPPLPSNTAWLSVVLSAGVCIRPPCVKQLQRSPPPSRCPHSPSRPRSQPSSPPRQVGASDQLRNIIDGESLLNDGAGLVIFAVMQSFVQGDSLTAAEVRAAPCLHSCPRPEPFPPPRPPPQECCPHQAPPIPRLPPPLQVAIKFVHLALGGFAVGTACGIATFFWLRRWASGGFWGLLHGVVLDPASLLGWERAVLQQEVWLTPRVRLPATLSPPPPPGLPFTRLPRSISRQPLLAVALSFTSAYASYYLSEEVFGASGMLAVVFNGFTLSIIGAAGPPDPL